MIEAVPVMDILVYFGNPHFYFPDWVIQGGEHGTFEVLPDGVLVHTLEGDHKGDIGDMLIQGVAGEIYPCKPDIFLQTYERVAKTDD